MSISQDSTDRSMRDAGLDRSLRDYLLDDSTTRSVAGAFIQNVLEECEERDSSFRRVMETWLTHSAERAMKLIAQYSESPIERIFLNALVMALIKWDSLGFCFMPPATNAPRDLQAYRQRHNEWMALFAKYQNTTGDVEGLNLPQSLDEDVANGLIPAEGCNEFLNHILFKHNLNIWNRLHFVMQPAFPDFRIDGRSIRADLLVWIPGNEKVKVIVECDGYEFHSNRDSFTNDRRCDRLFGLCGYEVLRYSGTEIHRDPVEASIDLFYCLHTLAGDDGPAEEDSDLVH
jgi:very-short-patch-repair endonuclease